MEKRSHFIYVSQLFCISNQNNKRILVFASQTLSLFYRGEVSLYLCSLNCFAFQTKKKYDMSPSFVFPHLTLFSRRVYLCTIGKYVYLCKETTTILHNRRLRQTYFYATQNFFCAMKQRS